MLALGSAAQSAACHRNAASRPNAFMSAHRAEKIWTEIVIRRRHLIIYLEKWMTAELSCLLFKRSIVCQGRRGWSLASKQCWPQTLHHDASHHEHNEQRCKLLSFSQGRKADKPHTEILSKWANKWMPLRFSQEIPRPPSEVYIEIEKSPARRRWYATAHR